MLMISKVFMILDYFLKEWAGHDQRSFSWMRLLTSHKTENNSIKYVLKREFNRRYLGNQWKLYILKKEETPTSCGFFAKKIKNS